MEMPPDLAPRLFHRFSSREGYELIEPPVIGLLRKLQNNATATIFARQGQSPQAPIDSAGHAVLDRLIVGLITNSDDRIPSVLSSLGVNIGPLRCGREADWVWTPSEETLGVGSANTPLSAEGNFDIDFSCISYDVGFEKPDRRIFAAAEAMSGRCAAAQAIHDRKYGSADDTSRPFDWKRVYIGDDYDEDVRGALGVGWSAVLFDPEGKRRGEMPELEVSMTHEEFFAAMGRAIRVDSTEAFLRWLLGA